MWKLPDGRTIRSPRSVTIDDINHPADIFFRWSIEELNAIGIYPFVEERYHSAYYRSIGFVDVITDGTMFRTHTLENRYTGSELKAKFIPYAKRLLRHLWKTASEELEYLTTFDSDNIVEIGLWQEYSMNLKTAFSSAKIQLQSITDYADGVEFIDNGFFNMLPTMPTTIEL